MGTAAFVDVFVNASYPNRHRDLLAHDHLDLSDQAEYHYEDESRVRLRPEVEGAQLSKQRGPAHFVVLTCTYGKEGKWVTAQCQELGTAAFGRTLEDAERIGAGAGAGAGDGAGAGTGAGGSCAQLTVVITSAISKKIERIE